MPEFYMIFTRKFFSEFWGASASPAPISYAYVDNRHNWLTNYYQPVAWCNCPANQNITSLPTILLRFIYKYNTLLIFLN